MTNIARQWLYRIAVSGVPERVIEAVPAAEREAYRQALRYVAGGARDDALRATRDLAVDRLRASIDFFGERVSDAVEASGAADEYAALAQALDDVPESTSLSIDLSHIGLDVSPEFCAEQLHRITSALPPWCRLEIGAEDASRTQRVLDVALQAAKSGARVMQTVQANLRRSPEDAQRLAAAGVPVRLVKGAYPESPDVALTWGAETDTAYVRLADWLHRAGVEVALATHDAALREALLLLLPQCEIQMLRGVLPDVARELARRGKLVRVYVPYGPNWARYWLRRVAESRGA